MNIKIYTDDDLNLTSKEEIALKIKWNVGISKRTGFVLFKEEKSAENAYKYFNKYVFEDSTWNVV